jgi:hypothetical protein
MADDSWCYNETRITKNPEYPEIHECQERPIILAIPKVQDSPGTVCTICTYEERK